MYVIFLNFVYLEVKGNIFYKDGSIKLVYRETKMYKLLYRTTGHKFTLVTIDTDCLKKKKVFSEKVSG